MLVSFVIPCYNSQDTIEKVVTQTCRQMDTFVNCQYEFILVNDGSQDGTILILKQLARRYDFVRVVDLSRNFGQHNALMAGLRYASGDIFVGMDDDLQTHPSQLPKLFAKLGEGYDVVYGCYTDKKHTPMQRIGSRFNHYTVRRLIGKPKELLISSFWVCRRFVRDEVIRYEYPYTNLQGLFLRTTSNIANVPIEHFERAAGRSNYTFGKLVKLWSSCTSFSVVPLRLSAMLGTLFLALGGIWGIVLMVLALLGNPVGSVAPVLAGMFFLSGVLLIFLGLIGEYVGRMFLSVNQSPQYVVRETCNLAGKGGKDDQADIDTWRGKRADRRDPIL
ncbi:glycosyltransferase family 2 protein [Candidatus Soleaferrea massiliensis]|uniref:glycosyltransferase family 2 protein n=1 Tax=Candidatus Soleaferrea massiliensis TaxID=1470354 RepID=UPI000693C622|nr:glycosyltransferase family 2 protein [Candidatus Soleaferrea massiliensis]